MRLTRLRLRSWPFLPPAAPPGRCQHTGARGTRCRRQAWPGTSHCIRHQPQPPGPPARA